CSPLLSVLLFHFLDTIIHLHQPDSHRSPHPSDSKEPHASGTTPLSRSAPSALYLIHADHAYQVSAHVGHKHTCAEFPSCCDCIKDPFWFLVLNENSPSSCE
ncbi:hypothetical protein XENOCAPTIV_015794, partial [Xenoophorus captivus]